MATIPPPLHVPSDRSPLFPPLKLPVDLFNIVGGYLFGMSVIMVLGNALALPLFFLLWYFIGFYLLAVWIGAFSFAIRCAQRESQAGRLKGAVTLEAIAGFVFTVIVAVAGEPVLRAAGRMIGPGDPTVPSASVIAGYLTLHAAALTGALSYILIDRFRGAYTDLPATLQPGVPA